MLNNELEHTEEEVHNKIAFEEMCGEIKKSTEKIRQQNTAMQKEIQQLKDKHEQANSLDVTKAAE